ncbi:MAG: S8 family serine peptidase [Candidatus Odinarchaeota archaeon]|nr:S8 family serine peptidase [Candidatus Odinarchaeota archaeon]
MIKLDIYHSDIKRMTQIFTEHYKKAEIPLFIRTKETPDEFFHHRQASQDKGESILESLNFKRKDFELITRILYVNPRTKSIALDVSPTHIKEFSETLLRINISSSVTINADVFPSLRQSRGIIGAAVVQTFGFTGKGVKIAVLDTGIDTTHPDLKYAVTQYFNTSMSENEKDISSHGTHVSGIIAGRGMLDNTLKGIAPGAELIGIKVLPGRSSDVAAGIELAIDKNADIINMSLGGPCSLPHVDDYEASSIANDMGVAVVVAAGNEGPKQHTIGSPGCNPDVITVGAVDKDKRITRYSSRGPILNVMKPNIVAPGGGVLDSNIAGRCYYEPGILSTMSSLADQMYKMGCVYSRHYCYMSGTSMATPHVSGAVAIIKQMLREKGITNETEKKEELNIIKALLYTTATKLGNPPYAEGFGLINIDAIYKKITSGNVPRKVPTLPAPSSAVGNHMGRIQEVYPVEIVHGLMKLSRVYDLLWMGTIGKSLLIAANHGASVQEVNPLLTKYQPLSPLVGDLILISHIENSYQNRDISIIQSIKNILAYLNKEQELLSA